LPGLSIEDVVENNVPQIRSPHLIDFRVGQTPTDDRLRPGLMNRADLCSQVAGGARDVSGEELINGERHGDWVGRIAWTIVAFFSGSVPPKNA